MPYGSDRRKNGRRFLDCCSVEDVADDIVENPRLSERFDDDGLDQLSEADRLAIVPSPQKPQSEHDGSGKKRNGKRVENFEEVFSSVDSRNSAHILLAAMIELVCSVMQTKPEPQRKVFSLVSKCLVKNGFLPAVVLTEELEGLRDQFRLALGQLLYKANELVEKSRHSQPETPPTQSSRCLWECQPSFSATTECLTSSPLTAAKLSAQRLKEDVRNSWSRYKRDFQEIRCLGRGGFGRVFKVVCKLDGCEYAVKKISFDVSDLSLCFKVLREVQLLAQLSHKNIVRYYNAWFEYEERTQENSKAESKGRALIQELSNSSDVKAECSESLGKNLSPPSVTFERSLSEGKLSAVSRDGSVAFEGPGRSRKSGSLESLKHWDVKIEKRTESTGLARGKFWRQGSSGSESSETSDKSTAKESGGVRVGEGANGVLVPFRASNSNLELACGMMVHPAISNVYRKALNLYVQMELCSLTLRDYIERRNAVVRSEESPFHSDPFSCVDTSVNRAVLKQTLKAVAYIHKRGIIHRDIKPGNIFLRLPNYEVLLGDFGLACSGSFGEVSGSSSGALYEEHSGEVMEAGKRSVRRMEVQKLTSGVGTEIYSAPEQLDSSRYGQKVDMFSVGIVGYEMFCPFGTSTERIHVLMRMRSGDVSEDFQKKWPIETGMILQLVKPNPEMRPTARQLLDSGYFWSENELKIQSLEREVLSQQEELKKQKEEIERLKFLLEKK